MLDTSARLLRLLTLLQNHRVVSASDLARRLDVTTRTVRRDVERLRDLGYPVEAELGTLGGYRLGRGARLPPLLLDDDEAVAVAVTVRAAVSVGMAGTDDVALRALGKLEQVMPDRLARRARTITDAIATPPSRGPQVDGDVLAVVAAAIRDRQQLRVDYRNHEGETSRRLLEPQRIVHSGARWYLLAWDVERSEWRVHRLDRLTPRIPVGPTFTERPDPEPDAVTFVLQGVQTRVYRHRCTVTVAATAAHVAEKFSVLTADVESVDASSCVVRFGVNDLTVAALRLLDLRAALTVREPAALRDAFAEIAQRIALVV